MYHIMAEGNHVVKVHRGWVRYTHVGAHEIPCRSRDDSCSVCQTDDICSTSQTQLWYVRSAAGLKSHAYAGWEPGHLNGLADDSGVRNVLLMHRFCTACSKYWRLLDQDSKIIYMVSNTLNMYIRFYPRKAETWIKVNNTFMGNKSCQ